MGTLCQLAQKGTGASPINGNISTFGGFKLAYSHLEAPNGTNPARYFHFLLSRYLPGEAGAKLNIRKPLITLIHSTFMIIVVVICIKPL